MVAIFLSTTVGYVTCGDHGASSAGTLGVQANYPIVGGKDCMVA